MSIPLPARLICVAPDTAAWRARLSEYDFMPPGDFFKEPYKNSVAGSCGSCGLPVWIGPEGKAMLDRHGPDMIWVRCPICGAVEHANQGGTMAEVIKLSNKKAGE